MNKKFKGIICIMAVLVMVMTCFAGCGSSDTKGAQNDAVQNEEQNTEAQDEFVYVPEDVKEFAEDELLSGKHHVEMDMGELGVIKLELDADQAPVSVTNFIQLAESGFYDGLTFHRVLTGGLIQGGCPNGNGMGGPGYRIKGEFSQNGVDNQLSHVRGAISMARTNDFDGGGCQFFIMSTDCIEYDGQYAAFGYVTEGMETVDKICNETPVVDWNGTVNPEDQPVITEVRVID